MKRDQLSNRIGNIDDKLVEQAENPPNFAQIQRSRNIRRMVSIAAVMVLMVASFVSGAIALAKETIVYVESDPEIVYVEKEQEIIVVGNSGISLLLPDFWAGKYGYEIDGETVAVYHLATHESSGPYQGYLFWITRVDGRYPMDYIYPEPGFTIAVTENSTYRFIRASDVQVDWSIPELRDGYVELEKDMKNIEIVLTAQMLENSMNSSNWVQGTVSVSFLDKWEVTKMITLSAEQSRIVREIIESQDYSDKQGSSTLPDLRLTVNGKEYLMNSTSGYISERYGAVLSAEDLKTIIDIVNG
jgi:hypothetical protein